MFGATTRLCAPPAFPVVFSPSLSRRVAGEDVAGEHAVADELAIQSRHTLFVEGRAAHGLGNMRALRDRKAARETPARPIAFRRKEDCRYWLLPRMAATKWPIRPRAISGTNRMGARRVLSLRGPSRASVRRALSTPDRLRILKVTPIARGRVPIVPLHVLPGARQDHAAHGMGGRRIAADEAVRISVDVQPLMRIDRGASELLMRASNLRAADSAVLAISMARSARHVPGMIQIQVGLRARHQRCIRESRVGVFGGESGDAAGLGHGGLHRRGRKVGGARRALALAEINRDAHAAVALVLECFDLPQAHAHRQARILAYRRFRLGCAARARLLERALYDGCEVFPGGA